MPRFYFDLVANGEKIADTRGSELPSRDDVRSDAIRTLTEASQSAPEDGEPHHYSITVKDKDKNIVFGGSVTATYRWEKQA